MNRKPVSPQERAIVDAIAFAKGLSEGSPERAMIARHVCVLASGLVETVVRDHLIHFTRNTKPKSELVRYVEQSLDRFQNPEFARILDVVGRFSPAWRQALEQVDDSVKSAINSVVSNRHLIAHGRDSGISLRQIEEYFHRIRSFVVDFRMVCK